MGQRFGKGKEARYTACVNDLDDCGDEIANARHSSDQSRRTVHHLRADCDKINNTVWQKCWLCKTSTHWPDQCAKFATLAINDRIATAKANHVCFSRLKRARRGHKMDNCRRNQQCTTLEKGTGGPQHHYQLLHESNAVKISVAITVSTKEAILPVQQCVHG